MMDKNWNRMENLIISIESPGNVKLVLIPENSRA
jgi:hypothetical protein